MDTVKDFIGHVQDKKKIYFNCDSVLSDWSYQSGKNRGGIQNLIAQVFHIVAMTIYLGFLDRVAE